MQLAVAAGFKYYTLDKQLALRRKYVAEVPSYTIANSLNSFTQQASQLKATCSTAGMKD